MLTLALTPASAPAATPAPKPITNPAIVWVGATTPTAVDARIFGNHELGITSVDAVFSEPDRTDVKDGWMLLHLVGDDTTTRGFAAFTDAIAAAGIASRKPLADINDVDYKPGQVYLVDQDDPNRAWLISSETRPGGVKVQAAIDAARTLDAYVRENGMHVPGDAAAIAS